MALALYNTLTRRKEPFVPRDPGRVTMYTCGPTVYDYTHIGHLRPALVADVLKRYLTYLGYRVHHVTNFTDVDDRIIARAREEGIEPAALAQRYIDDYLETMRRLRVDGVDRYVRVTDHIPDIVAMIEKLVRDGYAYPLDGDVYYAVERKADYGKLSGRTLEEMLAGARVEVNPRKRHPMDFALWKAAKPGEPAWPSPWGPGRPGWHIECSAMSLKYLGSGFDIHGGGDDLIFPHHENEIAQSEAFTGEAPFVRWWVHNGMVQVQEAKMSKSLGNFVALRELVRRFAPQAIRYFLLSTHYRKPIHYSDQALREAERGWRRLQATRDKAWAVLRGRPAGAAAREAVAASAGGPRGGTRAPAGVWVETVDDGPDSGGAAAGDGREPLGARLERLQVLADEGRQAFRAAMDDDLNTAGALAAVFELAHGLNGVLDHPDLDLGGPAGAVAARAAEALEELGGILGLWAAPGEAQAPEEGLVDGLVGLLLEVRQAARQNRDWATADRIRAGLADLGIVVEDTPRGTRWSRKA